MKTKFLVFFIGLSLLVSFNFAQAQTTDTTSDFEALTQALRQQIEELKARILQLQEELQEITTELKEVEKAFKFTKNLHKGLKDKEVEDLQVFLSGYPEIYPEGLITGYFGPLTEGAVKKFQEKHATDVLKPYGLNKGTGYVGTKTIAKMNELMAEESRIIICHYPPGNPDARHTIEISESALEAHLAHGDTIGPCEDEPEPEPEDVCPNIDGVQETIPTGMIQDDEGNCVEPEPEAVLGCTDETATNYNPEATEDDGSCVYPDTTPPVISNFQPTGTITDLTPTLSLNTDENATCRYSAVDQSFDAMSNTFSGAGTTYHYATLGTMATGTYTYYARCQDTAGNKNTVSASITFTITITSIPDTTPPANVTNFTAVGGDGQVNLSWTNPTDADFAGTKILRKTGSYPSSVTDGIPIYTSIGTSYIDTGLTNETAYYKAFTYDEVPNYSSGVGVTVTPTLSCTTAPQFLLKWGSYGSGDGQFNDPHSIAVDGSSNIYVTDFVNHRVQKFTSDGSFITKWGSYGTGDGQFAWPYGIAIAANNDVYVADHNNHRIQKFTSDGVFIAKWGSRGSDDGQFHSPSNVAVDANGNIYVTDGNGHRVQKFTSDRVFVTKWGSRGFGDGQFDWPSGIAIDANNDVYVADHINWRVQKFTSNGSFILKWGSYGTGDGQFNRPYGIAIDASSNIYVVETLSNHRVQKFAPCQIALLEQEQPLSFVERLLKDIQSQLAAVSAAILELLLIK